jgi:hypothetical protein
MTEPAKRVPKWLRVDTTVLVAGAVIMIAARYRPLGFAFGSSMQKAAAYAISLGIFGFGVWILIAGLSSSAPVFWICAALIPIAVGLLSAFGPS